MKKTAVGLLLALLCLLALCLPAAAAAADGEAGAGGQEPVIEKYAAQCTVDAAGQAAMKVTVDVTFPEAATEVDLPIGAGISGSVAGMEAETVSTDEGSALRIASEAGITGHQTFVITYTVPGAVSAQEEGQRLTLELIAPGWPWAMTEAGFAVSMPAAYTGEPVYVGGYYGDVVEDYMTLQNDGKTFSGVFKESLRDHESLRVTLDLPAGYVELSRGGISGTVAVILVTALALLSVGYWYVFLRDPSLSVPLRPLPPDGAGAGELPMLAGRGEASLALQVMQWAGMGYLTVQRAGRDRIVLHQSMPMGTERRRREQAFFSQLFARDAVCDGEGLRFGRLSQRYAQSTKGVWQRRLYARSGGSPLILHILAALAAGAALLGAASGGLPPGGARGWLLMLLTVGGVAAGFAAQEGVTAAARRQRQRMALLAFPAALLVLGYLWGGFLPVLLAVALQAFAALATLRGGRRSAAGRENLSQILGFQRYLQHVNANQLRRQLQQDSQYFYALLPFAEAVGQGGAFAAKFGRTPMEPCAWFAISKPPATAADFYRLFHDTLRRMERARR